MRRAAALLVILVAAAAGDAALSGDRTGGPGGNQEAAAQRFLEGYVKPDGRVVRRDQGGDTVSEGQAYAMLLAVATGDRRRFERVWDWTRRHLQRSDGLLAWHWQHGAVVDQQPAADADLDAVRALLIAAERFDAPRLADEARRMARAVLDHMVADVGGRLLLLAGPWARDENVLNPSYLAPRTFAMLASADARWDAVSSAGIDLVHTLQRSGLPPDWAIASPGGASPIGTPADPGAQARFGYNAARLPVRLAEACHPAAVHEAAVTWEWLRREQPTPAVRDLRGTPLPGGEHAVAAVGAAAAAAAAGDAARARALLRRADELDRRAPSYYGAAWAALGQVMLTTDWLKGCPPLGG